MYSDKQKMIITEVMVIANYQKMISIQQIKNLLAPYELQRDQRDFLILEILDMISEYKQIKLVVHEYLIHNCETLA
jgi:hypothetical protein